MRAQLVKASDELAPWSRTIPPMPGPSTHSDAHSNGNPAIARHFRTSGSPRR